MNNLYRLKSLDPDTLVCDSRDIAAALEIKHDNFIQTIETHKASIEEHFGHLLFQTGTVTNSVKATNQTKHCLLTEDQFVFIATLSRNSVKVVQVKASIVKAFSQARKALRLDPVVPKQGKTAEPLAALPHVSPRIAASQPALRNLVDNCFNLEDLANISVIANEIKELLKRDMDLALLRKAVQEQLQAIQRI